MGTRTFSQLLEMSRSGDARSFDELFAVVYDELRIVARRRLAMERPDHTLQATALVHEAYLRLSRGNLENLQDKAHFFALAARVMRQILVDHARRRASLKRRGGRQHLPLEEALTVAEDPMNPDLVALDQALDKLQSEQPEKAQVVEMRFFAGMTNEEVAEVLGVTPRTVQRYWTYAQARLYRELSSGADG